MRVQVEKLGECIERESALYFMNFFLSNILSYVGYHEGTIADEFE